MQMTEDEAATALYVLTNAHIQERFSSLKENERRLAHYTTADNALKIIGGKSMWLRNAALMNDFMEIAYGKSCLVPALEASLHELEAIVDAHHAGLTAEIITWLGEVEFTVNTQTYLTSFAETPADDCLGKLSMWRAYGGPVAGVALVFSNDVFETESTELNAFLHPVLYGNEEFRAVFDGLAERLRANAALIAQLPPGRVKSILFHALQDLVLTTKHKGFREEEEWRVIHSPFLFTSAFVPSSIECVGGIPQAVHKIELRNQPGLEMPELEMDRLIHSVIIGPCQYPQQVAFAIGEALSKAGVVNARARIRVSDIPVRQCN